MRHLNINGDTERLKNRDQQPTSRRHSAAKNKRLEEEDQ